MPRFIKKPVAIEAILWNGDNFIEVSKFCKGDAYMEDICEIGEQLVIKTLEGQHIASRWDYIIKGINGEHYPCKPDIFENTYYTEQEYAELTEV